MGEIGVDILKSVMYLIIVKTLTSVGCTVVSVQLLALDAMVNFIMSSPHQYFDMCNVF